MPEDSIYQIVISPIAKRALKKLSLNIRQRLDNAILTLSQNPRPPGVKALQGSKGLLRLRVGKYRIIYKVEDERLMVIVIQVGHRREVYRNI